MAAEWTIDELASRVAGALVTADYPGAPNGRVREVPDRRAIRWYATIGLLDRPAAMRGRTALYGPRHLLQLVAIKRRQAQGASLAQIQHELMGASDDDLGEIAGLPDVDVPAPAAPARARFWAQAPAAPAPPAAGVRVREGSLERPQAHTLLSGVPLGGGAVLLLPSTPDPDDLDALRAAAAPLLAELAARGLLDVHPTPGSEA